MAIAGTLRRYLQQHRVAYAEIVHPHAESVPETAQRAHVSPDHIAKGVVCKDEKGYLMAVIPGDRWLHLHALQESLGRPLQVAEEGEVNALFSDCDPGAVPPLGLAYEMETVVDASLTLLTYVFLESGDHQTLIRLNGEDFLALLGDARQGHFINSRGGNLHL